MTMKFLSTRSFLFIAANILFTICIPFVATAQQNVQPPKKMMRIFEDEDFINIAGHGTDESYTNGTMIDYFYTKPERSRFFLDRLFPSAGDSSVNTYAWGVAQLMFTPRDISKSEYQPNDYPYAGALFVTHDLYSYNSIKKYSLHTSIIAGIRGPHAYAGETQRFVHGLINYQKPMGWDNQLKDRGIININFRAEKQLYTYKNKLDVIGSGEVFAGNTFNGIIVNPTIRIGKMNPYFNGFISQYSASGRNAKNKKNVQAYLFAKPGLIISITNDLLKSDAGKTNAGNNSSAAQLKNAVFDLSTGVVMGVNRFGISFTQHFTSNTKENLYSHQVGNITLYFSFN
jgi:lipid A 3-O-deacylase